MSQNNLQPTTPQQPAQQKSRFSVAITTPQYKTLIANTLSDPNRCNRFIASITSAVSVNPALQDCTPQTIIAGALLGESLNLSPSPQLGHYYLVPFEQTLKDQNGNILYVTDADGNKVHYSVRYGEIVALNTYEIQKLKARIKELEERTTA